jgi:hypothetical protein
LVVVGCGGAWWRHLKGEQQQVEEEVEGWHGRRSTKQLFGESVPVFGKVILLLALVV